MHVNTPQRIQAIHSISVNVTSESYRNDQPFPFELAICPRLGDNYCAESMVKREAGATANKGRRTARRFPLHADVQILEPCDAHGVVINASSDGLRVAIDTELPVDAICVVEVQLDDGKTIELARVAWVRAHTDGYLVGLSFVHDE